MSLCEGERDGEGWWIEGWGGGDAEEGVFGDEGDEERGGCVSVFGFISHIRCRGNLRGCSERRGTSHWLSRDLTIE